MSQQSPEASSTRHDSTCPVIPRDGVFATTHWSVVLAAGQSHSTEARHALETLCRIYWYPLYAYTRRRGYSKEDAEDLVQAFLARLLEKNWLGRAESGRGRFRSFLLGAFDHFLANEWRKEQTLKRGGGTIIVPLEPGSGEACYGLEPATPATPEQLYERRWAMALLDEVFNRLGEELRQAGKADQLAMMKPCLVGDPAALPYAELAAKLGMSEGAVKVAVHRLRQRYRQLLHEEVAQTVASSDEVEEELRHLIHIVAGT